MKINKQKKFILCGGGGCCPTVEFKEKEILIKDDYGNCVRLSKKQWNDLTKITKRN